MDKRVESGREFWRAVLLAGGATAIPRPRTRRCNRAVSLEHIAAPPTWPSYCTASGPPNC